jgi:YhcH/YjgK/YiaL family protein
MIFDNIANRKTYYSLGKRIQKALEFVSENDFSGFQSGKYSMLGEEMFFLINDYNTKKEEYCILESHKKYIDLQYMIKGVEMIGITLFSDQQIIEEYNSDKDYTIYKPSDLSYVLLNSGEFTLFYPNDLHMPGMKVKEELKIKKVVVKILI